MILATVSVVRPHRPVLMGKVHKERKEMYDEVFSDVRWLADMGANESNAQEAEPDSVMTNSEPDRRRLRVLTPRQRARLIEPVAILYLG